MKRLLSALLTMSVCTCLMANEYHFGVDAGYDYGMYMQKWSHDHPAFEKSYYGEANGFHLGGTFQCDFLTGKHVPSITLGLSYQFLGSRGHLGLTRTGVTQLANFQNFENSETYTASAYRHDMRDSKDNFRNVLDPNAKDIHAHHYTASHAIEIPVRVRYTMNINDSWSWFVFTGPMFRFNCALTEKSIGTWKNDNGKQGGTQYDNLLTGTSTAYSYVDGEESKVVTEMPADDKKTGDKDWRLSWFNFMWGLGTGASWRNFSLSVSYDYGLRNRYYRDVWTYGDGMGQTINNSHRFTNGELKVSLAYRLK